MVDVVVVVVVVAVVVVEVLVLGLVDEELVVDVVVSSTISAGSPL